MSITKTTPAKVKITDGANDADVTASSALKVDGSAVTQPVSASSLPLPTGASTLAEQQSQTTLLGTIDADTSNVSTKIDTIAGAVSGTEMQVDVITMPTVTIQDGGGSITVDGSVSISGSVDTELATAITMSGAMANPTTAPVASFLASFNGSTWDRVRSQSDNADSVATSANGHVAVAAHGFVFNGTTWDRLRGSATDGMTVNLGANNDVTVSGVATEAKQDTIIGHVDGIEGLLTTIDADTSTLSGAVSGTEMQVDVVGALPSGNNVIGQAKITDGSTVADVAALPNSNALHVYVTDSLGNQITDFGTPTEYTEDVAGIADPVGTFPLFIRKDSPAGIVSTDGDAIAGRATNYGAQYVQVVNSSGSFVDSFGGGVQFTEGDTDTSITGTAAMWEDSADTLRAVSMAKPLPVQPGTSVAFPVTDNGGSLTVDGTTTTQYADGTAVATPTGNQINWDNAGTQTAVSDSAPLPVDIIGTANVAVTSFSGTAQVEGTAAHDAADSDNPVKIGYRAKNYGSLPTAVSAEDRTNGISDRYGAPWIQIGSPFVRSFSADYTADQTNTAVLSAAANESLRVYSITISIPYSSESVRSVTIGWGASTTPSSGDKVLFRNTSMVPGTYRISFPAGIAAGSGDDIRITTTGYTAGTDSVQIQYDLIAI